MRCLVSKYPKWDFVASAEQIWITSADRNGFGVIIQLVDFVAVEYVQEKQLPNYGVVYLRDRQLIDFDLTHIVWSRFHTTIYDVILYFMIAVICLILTNTLESEVVIN